VLLQQFGERKKKIDSLSQDAGKRLVHQSTGTAP
jgi:hypothetical protein